MSKITAHIQRKKIESRVSTKKDTFFIGKICIDVRREHFVILVMIMIIGLMLANDNAFEPLHHSSTDEPWNNQAHGEPVIRRNMLAVLHVCEDDITRGVHGEVPGDAGSVLGPSAAGEILGALEAHVQRALSTCEDPAAAQHVAQRDAAPHGGGGAAGGVAGAGGGLHDVQLLAAVPRADERGGKLAVMEILHKVFHAKPVWSLDQTGYFHGPVFPICFGDWTVVADVVEWRWGDEAVVHEEWEWGLRVEGVLPCEPHQGGNPWDPLVRDSLVVRVQNRVLNLRSRFLYQLIQIFVVFIVFVAGEVQRDRGLEVPAAVTNVAVFGASSHCELQREKLRN